jgi:cytochrome c-type biogenesis protein
MVKRLLISSSWQQGGRFFRRLAGTMIGLLGVYFIVQPFFSA